MTGATFSHGEQTSSSKDGNETVSMPSVTLITISLVVPTSVAVGVPLKVPVSVAKDAHTGLLLILKMRVSSSASDTDGVKLKSVPTAIRVSGEPVISGDALPSTSMLKASSSAPSCPSVTEIMTSL